MAQKKQPFDRIYSTVATSGTNDVKVAKVGSGWLWCVQRIGCINETNAYTKLRIIKAGRGGELILAEQPSPEADVVYWETDPIYLSEGQYLVARFFGCTANDVLKVYISGWRAKTYEVT